LIQRIVLDLVRQARTDGRTVLFSSHILPEVQEVCDRVGIIRDGRLVATESVEKLAQDRFHRLTLRLERMPPPATFDRDGAREIERHDQTITLEVREGLNDVLANAVQYGVLEIETHQVSLEEVFMEYYGKGGGSGD
jgi:ABC-2 type transport system ATP-binding protein